MRNIPDNNLAYPVLIEIDKRITGSGFMMNVEGQMFFATAKHVLFDEASNAPTGLIAKLMCPTDDLTNNDNRDLVVDLEACNMVGHSSADVAIIQIIVSRDEQNKKIQIGNGVRQVKKKMVGMTVAVQVPQATKRLAQVLVSNDVFLYGYPTSLRLQDSAQFDFHKPLLRKGIVANVYPEQSTIILDCPVYFGNSGGPVIEVEKDKNGNYNHKVIGVVSQYVPFVQKWTDVKGKVETQAIMNSGYSIAVSMDKVFELVTQLTGLVIP